MHRHSIVVTLLVLLCSAAVGCAISESRVVGDPSPATSPALSASVASVTPYPSGPTHTPTPTPRPSDTPTASATAIPSPSPTPQPSNTPTRLLPLVAIDPGHGGRDLGARHFDASGHMDFNEAEVNLDLALRLRDVLVRRGYRVVLTRDGDYQCHEDGEDVNGDGHHEYVVDENQARIDMINASGAELLLSIHQNAFEGQGAENVGGTVTYYCAHRPFSDRNLRFAELVQNALLEAFRSLGYDIRDRGVRPDTELQTTDHPGRHLILLGPKTERAVRPCQVPGVLSEALFITHHREAEAARDPVALDALAEALADAISAYFAEEGATAQG